MRYFLTLFLFLASFLVNAQSSNDQKLFKAVQENKTEAVESLLQKNANPDIVVQVGPWMKVNALITAVNKKNLDVVKLLVAKGANVNWQDGFDTSALMYAANMGLYDMVEYLLANGADIKAQDKQGNTVLSAAKESKNEKVIELISLRLQQAR